MDSQPNNQDAQSGKIYHERQSLQLCALHALNNLFQSRSAFTKDYLDAICKELAPETRIFNPHKSALGFGCYDVNVIISALLKKGYDVHWYDKRKNPSCLNLDQIYGFILNVPNVPSNGLLDTTLSYIPKHLQVWSSQKHWIAIRKIQNFYYNLDSKLVAPACIGSDESLIQTITNYCSLEHVEILVVVPKSDSEKQYWMKDPGTSS